MPRIFSLGLATALMTIVLSGPLLAQDTQTPQEIITQLEEESRTAYEAGKHLQFFIANHKLSELRPYQPEYVYNMVRACALLGRRSNAYHYMLAMQQQGLSYDFNASEDTVSIRNSEAYEYINNLMVQAGNPVGDGVVAFTLAGDPADFEVITWDQGREKFLIGTLSEGTVLAVGDDGSAEVLLKADEQNGLSSIHGLAVDAKRNRLWIASSPTSDFNGFSPAVKAHSALYEFNLETLERVGRYAVPGDELKHKLGSVAVTDDGHVYVIDRANPIVYRKAPDSGQLEAFVASKDLVRLTDIAVTPDNSRVFVADITMGVWVIDPIAQQAGMLNGPETLNLGGLAGIEFDGGNLISVQSGIKPQRLLRLKLDNTGSGVSEVAPMAIALESFDGPATGVIQGDSFYYFGNRNARDSEAGAIVMRTPLDAGSDIEPPGMVEFKQGIADQYENKQEQQQP
jgi:hypothetical protein